MQQIKYLQRLMLSFKGKQGTHPEDIQLSIMNDQIGEDKLTIQCSPVRYAADGG